MRELVRISIQFVVWPANESRRRQEARDTFFRLTRLCDRLDSRPGNDIPLLWQIPTGTEHEVGDIAIVRVCFRGHWSKGRIPIEKS